MGSEKWDSPHLDEFHRTGTVPIFPKFKLVDRGYKDTILLIPGWATDYRIFDSLDIQFNYLLPVNFSSTGFEESFKTALGENGIKKISVLGWSLGGFIASDLFAKYPGLIDKAILVGVRREYSKSNNDNIKAILEKNRKGFLRKFYYDCFPEEDKGSLGWFKANLLKDYTQRMELDHLIEGLDYLSTHKVEAAALNSANVTFVHGEEDRIAPIDEVMGFKATAPGARYVRLKGTGHMPFLSPKFKEIFDGSVL